MAIQNEGLKKDKRTEINVLGSDSLLDEVKAITSQIAKRYARVKNNEPNFEVADVKSRIGGVVLGEGNKNADAMALADLDALEQRLTAVYQSVSTYNKGDKTVEKVLYNILTVKTARERIQEIQEIRDRIDSKTADNDSLESDAQNIEDAVKMNAAQEDFVEMDGLQGKKLIVYGQRDENSVFDFWKFNKETNRNEFITAKEETARILEGVQRSREQSERFGSRIESVLAMDTSDAAKNQTQKGEKDHFGGMMVITGLRKNAGTKSFNFYASGRGIEVESYTKNSAIYIAGLSAEVLRRFETECLGVECLHAKLEEVDLKMKKKKFPDDVKYREALVEELRFAEQEKDKLKQYLVKLDKKLSEIERNKPAEQNSTSSKADILNRFAECCAIKHENIYGSSKISKIVDAEMASLYEEMKGKLKDDGFEQTGNKKDSDIFNMTTLPKNINEWADDQAQVLRLMEIAMTGQIDGQKLTGEQQYKIASILSVAVIGFANQEKDKKVSKGQNAENTVDVQLEQE